MSDIRYQVSGGLAHISLARASALNALSHDMIIDLTKAFKNALQRVDIEYILLDHAPDVRGFCAGGDVVAATTKPDAEQARQYFYDEYQLNHLIATAAKPVIALMDGVVMGGGFGLAGHAAMRIATERTIFAMPEARIGFFPDVGVARILAGLPTGFGLFLAMTAQRLSGAQMRRLGLATHYLNSTDCGALAAQLMNNGGQSPAEARLPAINANAISAPTRLGDIADIFGVPRWDEIEKRLHARVARGDDWAIQALADINKGAPVSHAISLMQAQKIGAHTDIASVLALDYDFACASLSWPDFAIGVHAVLVAKHHAPNWQWDMQQASAAVADLMASPRRAWVP